MVFFVKITFLRCYIFIKISQTCHRDVTTFCYFLAEAFTIRVKIKTIKWRIYSNEMQYN